MGVLSLFLPLRVPTFGVGALSLALLLLLLAFAVASFAPAASSFLNWSNAMNTAMSILDVQVLAQHHAVRYSIMVSGVAKCAVRQREAADVPCAVRA